MNLSTALVLLMTAQVSFGAVPRVFQEKAFTAASFADAVNHYVGLGEESAVRELRDLALDSFRDFADHRGEWSTNERIGWMCRVLFDPKNTEPLRQPLFGGLRLPYHTMPLKS